MSHLLQKLCGRTPLLHQRVCLVTRFAFPAAARKAMLGRVLYHIVDMDASWASGNTTAEAGVKPFYCVGYIWWLRPIELPTCGLLSSTGALGFSMDRQSAHAVFGSEPCPPGACFHVGALSLVAGRRVTRTVSSAHDDPALLQRSFFTHTSFSTECNSTGAIRTPNGNAVSRGTEASRFLKRCSGRTKRPKSA